MWIFSIENIDIFMELSCVELDHFTSVSLTAFQFLNFDIFLSK